MSEYRFTGPFYNDNEDHVYGAEERQPETEPDPSEDMTEGAAEEAVSNTAAEQEAEDFTAGNDTQSRTAEQSAVWESVRQPEQTHKKEKRAHTPAFGKKLLHTACIALVAGAVGGGAFLGVLKFGGEALGITGKTTPAAVDLQKNTDTVSYASTVKNSIDVSDVVDKCMPSVVSITTEGIQEYQSWFGTYQQPTSGSGSGIIVGESDTELLIATNYHVVSGSTNLNVFFSYDENSEQPTAVSAQIKGYDSQKDLAVIAVALSDIPAEARGKYAVATIGDSSQLKAGEQVVAIGNALGYGQSVTTGIVSALGRNVSVQGANGEVITNKLIQTDAAINPGNSGGALINMRGEIVGINSVKLVDQKVEGFGYAIPISDVEAIIGDLMNKEIRDKVDSDKAGYLGITPVDVSSDVSQTFDLPIGVYVKSVVKGGPAEAAGIKDGDVIVKLDGSTLASTAELREALEYYEAGETIDLIVKTRESGYAEQTITVTLGSAKSAGIE